MNGKYPLEMIEMDATPLDDMYVIRESAHGRKEVGRRIVVISIWDVWAARGIPVLMVVDGSERWSWVKKIFGACPHVVSNPLHLMEEPQNAQKPDHRKRQIKT